MSLSVRTAVIAVVALGTIAVAGCATVSPGARPDDMSAAEHQATAGAYEKRAAKHGALYNPDAEVPRLAAVNSSGARGEVDGGLSYTTYNPTEIHIAHAKGFREHARQHANAARVLEDFEDTHCRQIRKDVRSVCPLLGGVVAKVEDVENGVRVFISDDVETQAVAAHMKCHYAFGRKHGHEGMDACPLYLKGLQISVSGDHSVDITAEESTVVEQVRVRFKAHVDK